MLAMAAAARVGLPDFSKHARKHLGLFNGNRQLRRLLLSEFGNDGHLVRVTLLAVALASDACYLS